MPIWGTGKGALPFQYVESSPVPYGLKNSMQQHVYIYVAINQITTKLLSGGAMPPQKGISDNPQKNQHGSDARKKEFMIKRKTKEGKLITGLKGKTLFDLTAEERAEYDQYREKYWERFKKKFVGAIMAQVDSGERVNQCLPPYPPYWFVSEHGKVFSVKGAKLKRLKPFKVHTFKNIERFKLRAPYGDVFLSRIVADHFCSNEFLRFAPDEPVEVHHEEPWSENPDRAEVLKRLPRSIHKNVTYAQHHGTVEDVMEQMKKDYEYCKEHNLPIFNDLSDIFTGTVDCYASLPDEKGGCKVVKIRLTVKKPDEQQEQGEQTQETEAQQE